MKPCPEKLPRMDYLQYRKAKSLVHRCCNYDQGNCLLLDHGEGCICAQAISYSLLCRWFRSAVLPLDKELEWALLYQLGTKRCSRCGYPFYPGSNREKYCPACSAEVKRKNAAQRKRRQRQRCHALEVKKAL